ncbi:LOW QUALITY PROTEIN: hypothetical protein BC938DRAFT_479453 [Jimgerdemannia flammicorona]|uniref:Uncharacterized protein n=1 Tax=Jimgerdemannia flammicorona TaxID=994334 RepID=A0A433QY30_9FUNG|nr:LOW QUALITY PROTEIN: hypothetical protein BC938DRAFT_479453 [Jimgerdemannia flammicorona]
MMPIEGVQHHYVALECQRVPPAQHRVPSRVTPHQNLTLEQQKLLFQLLDDRHPVRARLPVSDHLVEVAVELARLVHTEALVTYDLGNVVEDSGEEDNGDNVVRALVAPLVEKVGEEAVNSFLEEEVTIFVEIPHLSAHMDEDEELGGFGAEDEMCTVGHVAGGDLL